MMILPTELEKSHFSELLLFHYKRRETPAETASPLFKGYCKHLEVMLSAAMPSYDFCLGFFVRFWGLVFFFKPVVTQLLSYYGYNHISIKV